MIKMDGASPDMAGCRCDELWVQQFWHHGELADAADVVWLKLDGIWHQLFFDGGVVHWRAQEGEPESGADSEDGLFRYPLLDLAKKFGLQGREIIDYALRETSDGEVVVLGFAGVGTLEFVNRGDSTEVRYRD